MKPKIVQISAIDVSMNNMLKLLNERTQEAGYEVHCICSPGENTKQIIDSGYHFHPVKIDRKLSPLKNIKSVYQIYKRLRRIKPDIVHVHTPIAGVLGRIAAKLANVNTIIYTAHGFYFHDGMDNKKYKIFYNIEKLIGRFCTDFIFTQSEEDYLLAKKNKFLKKDQYLHISNGIDLDNKYNYLKYNDDINLKIRQEYQIQENDLLITFIGRLVKEKGILDLIHAMDSIEDSRKVKLIALGNLPDSERDLSLVNEIKKNEARNENIIFAGRVNNVEEFLYSSDIFILPSYREGMPRSIIEAMAMKNAVIATNIRGSREEVDHEKNGLLVNVNSPKEIKNGIIYLMENPDILESMQVQGYKKALRIYNEEDVVSNQIEIFNKIIRGDYDEA